MPQKERYKTSIINLLRLKGPLSRGQIAEKLDLNQATVSILVNALSRKKIILEAGQSPSRGGRRSCLLELNPEVARSVGVEFEGNHIWAVLTDFRGGILEKKKRTTGKDIPRSKMIKKIISIIADILAAASRKSPPVLGIGVGLPGLIDKEKGVSLFYTGLDNWKDVPIRDILQSRFSLPVSIERSMPLIALAEGRFGAGRAAANLIVVTVRSGVGMGVIINGEIYAGASDGVGEIGHMSLDPDGPLCGCGQRGCVKAYASCSAIASRAAGLLSDDRSSILYRLSQGRKEKLSIETVIKAALQGDSAAAGIISEASEKLAVAVVDVVNFFNPDLVAFSSPLNEAREYFIRPIEEAVKNRCLPPQRQSVRICASSLDDFSGALGAALLNFG